MNPVRNLRFFAFAILAVPLAAARCGKNEQSPPLAGSSAASAPAAAAPAAPGPTSDRDLVVDRLVVDRQSVEVAHSKFDGGRAEDLFDDDPKTLARTEKANPATIELRFANPKAVRSLTLTTASMDIGLTVTVTPEQGQPKVFTKEYRQLPPDPTVKLDLDSSGTPAKKVRVEVKNLNGGDGHIHLRTLHLS